jgi:hypothetical protein
LIDQTRRAQHITFERNIMSIELNIVITPPTEIAKVLKEAHEVRHAENPSAGDEGKRRIKFDNPVPGTSSAMTITRNAPNPKVKHSFANYNAITNAAHMLLGARSLSSGCHVAGTLPILAAFIRVGLKSQYPGLPDSALEGITHDYCRIESLTVPYYFEYENETEAYRAYLDLNHHLTVVLECGMQPPPHSGTWKKAPKRITSDPDCRHAFFVAMPFGVARVSLKRDPGSLPQMLKPHNNWEHIDLVRATVRRLLCIEVKVDLRAFQYTDSSGLCQSLSNDHRQWVQSKMPKSPAEIIWDAFLYQCWFNVPLAVDELEVDKTNLNGHLQTVVDDYLAGKNVTSIEDQLNDWKQFHKDRETLISKAHIEILNPWAINKLNRSKELAPQYMYEQRFQPDRDADLAPHTLSKDTINAAILGKVALMQGRPGWSFDASAYEVKDE